MYKRRRKPAIFSGNVLNCAIWIPDSYGAWKCGKYGRVCETEPTGQCAPLLKPKSRQVKACVKTQKVYSMFLGKDVKRCKKYAPTCSGSACMSFTMPYPQEASEKTRPAPAEIRSLSAWMAETWNEEMFGKQPYLARDILERGGIKPPRIPTGLQKSPVAEEYKSIPLFLRNRRGMALDEVAAEMGYDSENELMRDIQKAYPPKTKGEWKSKQRRKKPDDFIDSAYELIEEEMAEGRWT